MRLLFSRVLPCIVATLGALAAHLPCHALDERTPRQLIDDLGIEVRQLLETPQTGKTPEDAERAVAAQITALIARSEGDLSLTQPDSRGRTPLMSAVSDAYPLIVKALLADPSVKLQVNAANAAGETAWMLANFAPSVTLVACQPGTLTLERAPLLPPYLRRMSALLQGSAAGLVSILQMLQAAGAVGEPDAVRAAWLSRCPNTTPELRDKLASGQLMTTVVTEAVAQQLAFNKSAREGRSNVPSRPPADMKFVKTPVGVNDKATLSPPPPLLSVSHLICVKMPKPDMHNGLNWRGRIRFKAMVSTRAGVVEAVDLGVVDGDNDPPVVSYFTDTIVRALAGYQCKGESLFEQEFEYRVQ